MKKVFLFLFLLLLSPVFAYNLDDKIGQMIIVGFDGNTVNSKGFKEVLKQIKNQEISGVILFKKNIKSKEDLIKMNEKLLSSSKITPFISIDNEGGEVQRYDFEKYKSAKEVSKLSEKEAHLIYGKMADDEKELKINFNFAPCVDIDINPSSIISKKQRSYSNNYIEVSKFAKIFIKEHNDKKIITSIKHFPGHGSVKGDTHKGFVDATDTFIKDEIMPYYRLSDYGSLNTVMISHIYNSNFDKEFPASLSKKTVKGLLINSIGFKGVIVSDDFDMKAIKDNYSLREIVVNSINAGVNILLFSNNIEGFDDNLAQKIHKIIKEEIKNGNIDYQDIENSFVKIMALKSQL